MCFGAEAGDQDLQVAFLQQWGGNRNRWEEVIRDGLACLAIPCLINQLATTHLCQE